jgi:hypothetical protein
MTSSSLFPMIEGKSQKITGKMVPPCSTRIQHFQADQAVLFNQFFSSLLTLGNQTPQVLVAFAVLPQR